MTDLDRLEHLTRLRDAGALTIEEFNEQKARLLAHDAERANVAHRPSWLILATVVVALAIISGFALLSRRTTQDMNNGSLAAATQATMANAIEPEKPQEPQVIATPETYGLTWASSEAVLGLNPAFLEAKLGPAKVKNASGFDYDIGGCGISYGISDGRVNDVTISLSKVCSPIVAGQKLWDGITFGQISNYNGNLRADCMMLCGNAADPTIEYFVPGYHANNFVQYEYSAVQDKEADEWQTAIRLAHGHAPDDYQNDDNDWYQCVSDPPPPVQRKARSAKIAYVRFGYEWKGGCDYG